MEAAALRWVLAIIGIVLLVGIYLYSLHQNRLRQRAAMDTFAREEIDSAFIEDEQLREELEHLNEIMNHNQLDDDYDQITINPAIEADLTPIDLPAPKLYVAEILADINEDNLINYLLKHADHRLITGEEINNALLHCKFEMDAEGYLEYRQQDQVFFKVASLSSPGHFLDIDNAEFNTIGFNCFIDIGTNPDAASSYELMLKKIDELVRLLNVKVFLSTQELLTISNITQIRKFLKS